MRDDKLIEAMEKVDLMAGRPLLKRAIYGEYAHAALSALTASGYVVVPREPTKAMLNAGDYAISHGCYASGVYADMLAAAPQPEEAQP